MVKQTAKRLLKRIYNSSPGFIRKSYGSLVAALENLKSYWIPINVFEGKVIGTDETMKFAYLGRDAKIISYWLQRVFTQYEQVSGSKKVAVWKINDHLAENSAVYDMALMDIKNKILWKHIDTKMGFVLPRWLIMQANVENAIEIMQHGDVARRIRKHGFQMEKKSTEEDFRFFYERMHRPYIELRHGNAAFIENYKDMLELFRKRQSRLYFILKDGKPVAATFHITDEGVPHMYALGVLDGSEEIMRTGVLGSTYYFPMVDYHENNIRKVHLGGTSPIVRDGLTSFKLSIGGRIAPLERQHKIKLWLVPLRDSRATRSFLMANPFIYINENKVYLAIFIYDEVEKVGDLHLKRYLKTEGVQQIHIFTTGSVDTVNRLFPVSEMKDTIVIPYRPGKQD